MKILRYIVIGAFATMAASCSMDLDVNDNPNSPAALNESVLLPRVQRYIGESLAIGSGFSNFLAVYTHQMSTRESAAQYGVTGGDFFLQQGWDYAYRDVITNANAMIAIGTENDNLQYVGIAKILKAYMFSQLVDVFGDIPFTEANQLVDGILYPVYDDDASIYPQLLALLDEAKADLLNEESLNLSFPEDDDLIYGGDPELWIKAANTLKLKLLVQQRKVTDVSAEVNALLDEGELISTTAESFLIPYGPNAATDDRNKGFGDYYATQRSNHISPWLYEIMKGYNPIFRGIEDPRVPYYIYNQLRASAAPATGLEYRDGGFVSIYFASDGPNRDQNNQNSVSLYGIYPVGGRYDDGNGGTASASSGTGAAPYRLITYADRLYLEAELIAEGIVAGGESAARDVFEEAMNESFRQVDFVVDAVSSSQSVPDVYSATADSPTQEYISSILDLFDSNSDRQLEYIMTQKWLSSMGSSVDQYTDYRRTGFPVLFDPMSLSTATPPAGGNGGEDMPAVPLSLSRPFPVSLPYSSDDLNKNRNAPAQKTDLGNAKVFWMP